MHTAVRVRLRHCKKLAWSVLEVCVASPHIHYQNMSKLARTTVKPGRPREPLGRRQIQEDDYLDTDSEVDEFATPGAGPSGSGSSDVDQSEGDEDESDEGEDGVGQWEPDDWQEGDEGGSGSDSGDGSGSEEEQEEDVDEAVCPCSTLPISDLGSSVA